MSQTRFNTNVTTLKSVQSCKSAIMAYAPNAPDNFKNASRFINWWFVDEFILMLGPVVSALNEVGSDNIASMGIALATVHTMFQSLEARAHTYFLESSVRDSSDAPLPSRDRKSVV